MIAVFCGSRDWSDAGAVSAVMRGLVEQRGLYMVVHGDQRGADRTAGAAAAALGLEVKAYPADWDRLGDAAGPARNLEMRRALLAARKYGQEAMVVAFHEDPGLGAGTREMVRQSLRLGIECAAWVSPPPADGRPCRCRLESHAELLTRPGHLLSCHGGAFR